jgi:hypothetical protein
MLQGNPPRLPVALLALALAACGGEAASYDDDSDPSSEQPRDDASVDEVDDDTDDDETAVDSGVAVDAGRTDREPMPTRDAATSRGDAQAAQMSDASLRADAAVEEAGRSDAGLASGSDAGRDGGTGSRSDAGPPPLTPAFHIALRVHRGDSGLSGAALASVLEEMNEIWWKQAGICFEVEIVRNDEPRRDGFDFWFHRSQLGCGADANGVFCGDHDIHSLDVPSLNRADNAQWDTRQNPARTSAHELGHGLNLQHYNGFPDSNDSLMSSGRQGFKLHESEVTTARRRAQMKAIPGSGATPCAAVPVVD